VEELSSPVIERVVLKNAVGALRKSAIIEMFLPAHLACFRGHFPNFPIVPGFVQLEWTRAFAAQYLEIETRFRRVHRAKFLLPLLPERHFELQLWDSEREEREVEFSITERPAPGEDARTCTKGTLYFERRA